MSAPRIAVAAAAAALAALAVAAPAAAAGRAVTVPALSPDGATVGPAVTVAARSFPPGRRFVSATVRGRHATTSTRRPMMLSVLLICGAESVQATTNVLTEVVLTPRRLMTDPADCRVIANSAVGRAGADDGLDVTATISAAPAAWGAVGYRPDDWPKVLRPGARHDVVPVTAAVPAGSATVRLAGDIKVTTCTSVGGSRENGSPYLCDPDRVRRGGSALYVALVAAQRAVGGGYCAVRTVASRTVHVDAKTHHAMVAQSGTYRLSGAGKCTRDVTVKVYTRILGGADVVVHRKGSITTVYG